jgi:mono/diheme cytochrome c family protein
MDRTGGEAIMRRIRLSGALLTLAAILLAGPPPGFAGEDGSWPRLEVRHLANASGMPNVDVEIADDPAYGTAKRYRGIPLDHVLDLIADIERYTAEGALVVFEASDGYVAAMALGTARAGGGVIATRDLDAPAGNTWIPWKQDGRTVTPAPLYLVWHGVAPDDWRYVWPYQLVTIAIKPFAAQYGAAVPETDDAAVRRGFEVARVHCLKCHSVNLAGGDLGPELNVPRNVTEYWRPETLPAFIRDPLSFRAGARMPAFGRSLDDGEIADTVAYLTFMAGQKICGGDKACE